MASVVFLCVSRFVGVTGRGPPSWPLGWGGLGGPRLRCRACPTFRPHHSSLRPNFSGARATVDRIIGRRKTWGTADAGTASLSAWHVQQQQQHRQRQPQRSRSSPPATKQKSSPRTPRCNVSVNHAAPATAIGQHDKSTNEQDGTDRRVTIPWYRK